MNGSRTAPSVNEELNHAIIADDLKRVSYLLDKKHADINASDLQGETPLGNAVHRTSLPLVKYLVDHGADVDLPDRDGWTPLMQAAWLDHRPDHAVPDRSQGRPERAGRERHDAACNRLAER